MRESEVLKLCMLAAAECGVTLLRNNRGMFLTLDGKRKVRAGLEAAGSADLIGWNQWGRIVCVEVKAAKGRVSDDQNKFLEAVKKSGGIAFVARSPDDVRRELCV